MLFEGKYCRGLLFCLITNGLIFLASGLRILAGTWESRKQAEEKTAEKLYNEIINLELNPLEIGKGRVMNIQQSDMLVLNFGALIETAEGVAQELNATLLDMRYEKPYLSGRYVSGQNNFRPFCLLPTKYCISSCCSVLAADLGPR